MRYRRDEVGLVWVDLKFVTIVNVVTNVGAKQRCYFVRIQVEFELESLATEAEMNEL